MQENESSRLLGGKKVELRLGFEPQKGYLKYELYKGAMKLVRDVMLTKPGETVMITADT